MAEQPIKVSYLLAVWGEQYIRQFMDLSLRSLLAPGNIPGLAEHAETTFVFLTRKIDRKTFTGHSLFKRLSRYCRVEFVTIDDLIFSGNYSATLTLAYERGMRHAGNQMLSTYFIYLVADYVLADGSLLNLLPHMKRGVSGITAGNYQVIEEDLLETFKMRVNKTTGVLSIPPRELVSLTLPHLHPLTVANIVNQNYSHTDHTNRLFWRVDKNTLVGRFYLRHMLCIRPEVDNYVIGASCDYSFISEMCPSGNVWHIADSDEYCVIELQPFAHEQKFIKYGPFKQKNIVRGLSKWITRTHRDNAFYPVIYHGNDIAPNAQEIVTLSRKYIENIERELPAKPQSLRAHPYWISCLEGILEQLSKLNNQSDYFKRGVFGGIVGSPTFEPPLGKSYGDYHLLKKIRYQYGDEWRIAVIKAIRAISGSEAEPRIWHREYAHSRAINAAITKTAAKGEHFFFISYEPTSYADWCYKNYRTQAILQKSELFDVRPVEMIKQQAQGATSAVILLPLAYVHKLGELLAKCAACLSGDKHVTIIVTQRYLEQATGFKRYLAILATYYENSAVDVQSFITVTNPLRKWLDEGYQTLVNMIMQPKRSPLALAKRIAGMAGVILLSIGYTAGNFISRKRNYPHRGEPTCAILTLALSGKYDIVLNSERKALEEMYE